MNNDELLKAIEVGFKQSHNGYYMSKNDLNRFEYALQVLNNVLKTYKDLDNNGRLEQ